MAVFKTPVYFKIGKDTYTKKPKLLGCSASKPGASPETFAVIKMILEFDEDILDPTIDTNMILKVGAVPPPTAVIPMPSKKDIVSEMVHTLDQVGKI